MEEFLKRIWELAGTQRNSTFYAVASAAIKLMAKHYVETGCYRGIDFDGRSTLIWALLADYTGGHLTSIDLSPDSIAKAAELCDSGGANKARYELVLGDSVVKLADINHPIDVLYLDSFDHEDKNPQPCQLHQLKEAEICIPKMAERSIIMLDDCEFKDGGKAKLSAPFIVSNGFKVVVEKYQNVYQRGCDDLF